MLKEIEKAGGKINKIYFCPHLETDNCNCRKPKIGMIEKAIQDFPSINIKESYLIDMNLELVDKINNALLSLTEYDIKEIKTF